MILLFVIKILFVPFQFSKRYGSVFTVYMGPSKVVVLAGYQTIKEAFVNYAEEFGDREIPPVVKDSNLDHGDGIHEIFHVLHVQQFRSYIIRYFTSACTAASWLKTSSSVSNRGRMGKRWLVERNAPLRFGKPERLWDGEESVRRQNHRGMSEPHSGVWKVQR